MTAEEKGLTRGGDGRVEGSGGAKRIRDKLTLKRSY